MRRERLPGVFLRVQRAAFFLLRTQRRPALLGGPSCTQRPGGRVEATGRRLPPYRCEVNRR